jgi:hypothetical protein
MVRGEQRAYVVRPTEDSVFRTESSTVPARTNQTFEALARELACSFTVMARAAWTSRQGTRPSPPAFYSARIGHSRASSSFVSAGNGSAVACPRSTGFKIPLRLRRCERT